MSDTIAEERTTLPEGATVSVSRLSRPKLGPFTEIRAWMDSNIVKMRGDDITPGNLRWYLHHCVLAINRERLKLDKKPGMLIRNPKGFREFVNNMAFYGMFIFEALVSEMPSGSKVTAHDDGSFTAKMPEPEKPKKVRRQRKVRKEKAVVVPANGNHPF